MQINLRFVIVLVLRPLLLLLLIKVLLLLILLRRIPLLLGYSVVCYIRLTIVLIVPLILLLFGRCLLFLPSLGARYVEPEGQVTFGISELTLRVLSIVGLLSLVFYAGGIYQKKLCQGRRRCCEGCLRSSTYPFSFFLFLGGALRLFLYFLFPLTVALVYTLVLRV